MKKFDYKKIGLGLMVFFVVVGLVGYFMKSKNKETIIDLGDGWKSYSHEDLGLIVRVPEDTEIVYKVEGDKKCCPTARFSKGPISILRTSFYSHNIESDYESNVSENRERVSKESGVWESLNSGRRRYIYREVFIDGVSAFLKFREYDIQRKGEKSHTFKIDLVRILNEEKESLLFFDENNSESTERFYEVYPDLMNGGFSDEEIERRIQSHIEVIKGLIVSVRKG